MEKERSRCGLSTKRRQIDCCYRRCLDILGGDEMGRMHEGCESASDGCPLGVAWVTMQGGVQERERIGGEGWEGAREREREKKRK